MRKAPDIATGRTESAYIDRPCWGSPLLPFLVDPYVGTYLTADAFCSSQELYFLELWNELSKWKCFSIISVFLLYEISCMHKENPYQCRYSRVDVFEITNGFSFSI